MNIYAIYNNKNQDNLNAFQFKNAECGIFNTKIMNN